MYEVTQFHHLAQIEGIGCVFDFFAMNEIEEKTGTPEDQAKKHPRGGFGIEDSPDLPGSGSHEPGVKIDPNAGYQDKKKHFYAHKTDP